MGHKGKGIVNLALDRISAIDYDFNTPFKTFAFDADTFYADVIGVTVNQGEQASVVKLWIDKSNAPYALTKPLHHSQIVERENEDGSIVAIIKVKLNFELERLILGFGDAIAVFQPQRLRKRIAAKLQRAVQRYN